MLQEQEQESQEQEQVVVGTLQVVVVVLFALLVRETLAVPLSVPDQRHLLLRLLC